MYFCCIYCSYEHAWSGMRSVGGLVEYPCQNRNAAGVANAIIAAEMALAGIPQLIPLDEMIQTMFTVGKKLHAELL